LRLSLAGIPGVLAVGVGGREWVAVAESRVEPESAAALPAIPCVPTQNEGEGLRTALPFRLRDDGDTGGVIIDPDGLASAVRDLVERYGARLDVADLLERVEERAAVMEFDGGLSRGEAERAAISELRSQLLKRRPSRPAAT